MRGAGESKQDGKRANVMLASARAGRHQHTTWHMTGHTTWHTALKPAIHAAIPTGIRAHHCLPLPLCLAVSLPPAHRHRPSARGRQWSRHASRLMPSDTRPDRSAYSFAPPHTPHAHAQARQRRLRLCSCSHTHTHTHTHTVGQLGASVTRCRYRAVLTRRAHAPARAVLAALCPAAPCGRCAALTPDLRGRR